MSHPKIRGLIIRPDKTVTETTFGSLSDFQKAVGGYIEAVGLSDGSTMYVDEEYLIKGYGPEDFNSIARDVAGLGGHPELVLQGILGPVVIVGPVNQEGWDTDIPPTARQWVERVMREAGGRYIKQYGAGDPS